MGRRILFGRISVPVTYKSHNFLFSFNKRTTASSSNAVVVVLFAKASIFSDELYHILLTNSACDQEYETLRVLIA